MQKSIKMNKNRQKETHYEINFLIYRKLISIDAAFVLKLEFRSDIKRGGFRN